MGLLDWFKSTASMLNPVNTFTPVAIRFRLIELVRRLQSQAEHGELALRHLNNNINTEQQPRLKMFSAYTVAKRILFYAEMDMLRDHLLLFHATMPTTCPDSVTELSNVELCSTRDCTKDAEMMHKALNDIQTIMGMPITPQPEVNADDVCHVLFVATLIRLHPALLKYSEIHLVYRRDYSNFRARIGLLESDNVAVEFQMMLDDYVSRGINLLAQPVSPVAPVASDVTVEVASVAPELTPDAEVVTIQEQQVDPTNSQQDVLYTDVPLQGIQVHTSGGDPELVVEHTCSA